MIYYISDTHFGHYNIIKLTNRPFVSLEEMNSTLIKKWNNKVSNGDTVYIIGDLFYRSSEDPELILKQLKGKKHLIIGNHDKKWLNKVDLKKYFISVNELLTFSNGKNKVTLCHYPMLCFEGTYLIHGHIHNNDLPLLKTMNNVLNASVEINNYEPVTFVELVKNNQIFKGEII
ncbi:MAG: metallophosphoesterase [Bacillales bacterium]|jgi:calcineurin-like phosphoesterase family protein|nr:metallophosphoesterase [Bacillales bacterium]